MTDTWVDPPATAHCPDHSTCRHKNCGRPISWDEYCYTHDDSGFADCRMTLIRAGERVKLRGVSTLVDRDTFAYLSNTPEDQTAEPKEWDDAEVTPAG